MPSEEQYRALEKRISFLERLERPQKSEEIIAAYRTRVGASAPTLTNRAVGASGNVLLPVAQFSLTTQQDVYFLFHVPEEHDDNFTIEFHAMWLPGSAWSAGNYRMKLEYLVKLETAAYNTGAPTTIEMSVTPANATNVIETEFTDKITAGHEQMVWCHFYRDVANDNGDSTMDLMFFEFEYHIR